MTKPIATQSFASRIALVTGVGRRQGIGAAICRALAEHGADVFFTYWHAYDGDLFPKDNQLDPRQFARDLEASGVRAAFTEMDLSALDSAATLFQEAERVLGRPTILINNACYDIESPFVALREQSLDQHYAINVRAVTMLCKEFVKQGRPGSIINMTSGQSLGPMGSDKIPYTITKASVEMLTKQLAPDLQPNGITINALDPGPTDTGWMTDELKAQIVRESKRGSVTVPADIAALIVQMLCDARATGQVIHAVR